KFKIRADCFHVKQHSFEIAGNRDLRHRKRELSAADPHSGRTARVISGHDVNTEAHQFYDVEALLNSGDDLFRRSLALPDKEISMSDSGIAGEAARGVARRPHAKLARRVRVQQIALQHAVFDYYRAARRN